MPKNGFDWLPSPSQHFLVVTFALLVYVSAWLKCHYPDVFAACC